MAWREQRCLKSNFISIIIFFLKCKFIPYLNWGVLMLKIRSKRSSGIAIIIHGHVMARWHRMAKITWLEARTCRCFRPAWIPTWVVDMVVKGWQIHLTMPVHKAVHEWPFVRLVQWWISGCFQPRWFHWKCRFGNCEQKRADCLTDIANFHIALYLEKLMFSHTRAFLSWGKQTREK